MTRAVIRTGGRGLTPVEHPADRHGDGFADPQPAVTFADELEHLPFDELLRVANDASSQRVAAALAAHPLELTLHDFAALLSRAAGERLPDIADASRRLPGLRQDPALVVGAVPRMAAVRAAFRRRHRLPHPSMRPRWQASAPIRACPAA